MTLHKSSYIFHYNWVKGIHCFRLFKCQDFLLPNTIGYCNFVAMCKTTYLPFLPILSLDHPKGQRRIH